MLNNVKFTICLAGRIIEIGANFRSTKEYCKDYLCESEPELCISVNRDDIYRERKKSEEMDLKKGNEIRHYSDSYLETLALYRKIAEKLVEYDVLLFHGSCISVDNEGYLFTAPSGTGKSTHTKLWREYFGNRAVMVNDDKPLIAVSKNEIRIYGTPWNGKHHLGENMSVPLKAVCFLQRGNENKIEPVCIKEVLPLLYKQIYHLTDKVNMEKVLELILKLGENTKFYKLSCNMQTEAAKVAYDGMKS